MNKKHPIISVTGSSGAGTSTVKSTFEQIFRREGIKAVSIEGDAEKGVAWDGPLAVMIARGDLAVECGFERLAEVQEEILWLCEAAHVPVIWATQVLESLARTGLPSRAEITDAAMGNRAECVMLNKGPHIIDALEMLADILVRMQDHQHKKRSMLRALSLAQIDVTALD